MSGSRSLTYCIRHRDGSLLARIDQTNLLFILQDAKFDVNIVDNETRYVVKETLTFGVDGLKIFVWAGYYIALFKG